MNEAQYLGGSLVQMLVDCKSGALARHLPGELANWRIVLRAPTHIMDTLNRPMNHIHILWDSTIN